MVQLDEPGDVFFVMVPSGATAPTEAEILAGTASGGTAAVTGGSFNIANAFEDVTELIDGLTEGTSYDIYIIAQDTNGNNSLAQTLNVTTTSTDPTLTASSSNIDDLGFDLTLQVDEAAEVYYVAVKQGETAPTENDIIAGVDAFGEEPIVSGNVTIDIAFMDVTESITGMLSGIDHDVYVLAQDLGGNNSTVVLNVKTTLTTKVSASDSLALVALYNSTEGDNWVDKSKWLKQGVAKWFGITVNNKRVTRVELPSNGLVGPAPSDLRDLTALGRLDLSDNEVNALPKLSRISNINILAMENNRLRFEDIIPNLGVNGFTFDPQKNLMADVEKR